MKKCWCGNEDLHEYSDKYYVCDKCHTLLSKQDFENRIYDVENEEDDLYGKNYWEVSMTRAAGKNSLSEVVDMYLTERVIYWLKFILKYVKLGGAVAEVGCGLGQLQYVMRRLQYNQKAFELSNEICSYMERELRIKAYCDEFEADREAYDGILAFDLFEHLISPHEFLDNCSESLKENGVLCFQTPCYDPGLNYDEMKQKAPKFMEQLKYEQHIYLYSKQSMKEILNQHGFKYIEFEPAFFGDNYDMFFFASKQQLKQNSDEEIDAYLNGTENGRLVKAMITLFDENDKMEKLYEQADKDRNDRLNNINILEKRLEESESDRSNRLTEINEYDRLLKESNNNLVEAQKKNEQLSVLLQKSEKDREDRLNQINELTDMLKESDEDRQERLKQIEELSGMLSDSERDRQERLKQIEELSGMLSDSERDRQERAEQIDRLTAMLKESEADREARFVQIQELTKIIDDMKNQKDTNEVK